MRETPTFDVAGIVAPHGSAAEAARDILIEGGNAIEAAVAAAAVAALVLPHRNGIGGDGSWIIREAGARGRTRVIDARGPAGLRATIQRYRDQDYDQLPRHGLDAVLTVPGAVAGWRAALDLAQAIGGRLPVARLLEAAVKCAHDGMLVSAPALRALSVAPASVTEAPGFAAAFLDEGKPPAEGFLRHDPALAQTLAYLAHAGLDDLYRGDVGREIATELEDEEHVLGRDDLRRFEARWRPPATLNLFKTSIETPAGSAGFKLLPALGLFERLKPRRAEGFDHVHGLIEALRAAQSGVAQAEAAGEGPAALLDDDGLDRAIERLDRARAGPAHPPLPSWRESGIWIGVIDGTGLAVSLVQSLGGVHGSGVVLERTGILLGNRGTGFGLDPHQSMALHPGRRPPMASLPAVVSHGDGQVMVFGAGGSGAVPEAQVFARIRLGVGLTEAVEAPRFAWGRDPALTDPALILEDGFDPSVIAGLGRAGHPVVEGTQGAGDAVGVLRRASGGRIEAAPDPREEGAAAGF